MRQNELQLSPSPHPSLSLKSEKTRPNFWKHPCSRHRPFATSNQAQASPAPERKPPANRHSPFSGGRWPLTTSNLAFLPHGTGPWVDGRGHGLRPGRGTGRGWVSPAPGRDAGGRAAASGSDPRYFSHFSICSISLQRTFFFFFFFDTVFMHQTQTISF